MDNISKVTIQMAQINNSYGNNIFIPYSIGVLRAYSEKDALIKEGFEFKRFIYKRDAVSVLAADIGMVDILCLSCYIWNWRLSMAVASEVRKRNKDCLIIVGGPQVPDDIEGFFKKYPYIDIAIHGEGEETFSEILRTYLNNGSFEFIPGMTYYDRENGVIFKNEIRGKIANLDDIPSPYLSDIFKELVENDAYDWTAMWETNRGCPFKCAYCDWGTDSKKVRNFGMHRLYKEMEWFGKNKIQMVFGCDANFGMFKRDSVLINRLVKTKKMYGYPRTFRVCNTKNSNEIVFNIESALYEAGMSKGASLSMQSLSDDVLKNIKRSNMKIDTFFELQAKYIEKGMSTYTELILPLPGETYSSFIRGISKLMENGQHRQIYIYNCSIMPNAEMGQKKYQEEHGIKTVEIPIFQAHSTPNESVDDIVEYEEIVIETNTMSVSDWRASFCFAWAVQCFHFLGVLQTAAILMYGRYKIEYYTFYEMLIRYGRVNKDTLIGGELIILDNILDKVLNGIGFDQYLPDFGKVTWPPEEASFLRLSENLDVLYLELAAFLKKLCSDNNISLEDDLIENLLKYQRARLVNYTDGDESLMKLNLNYNIPEYVDSIIRSNAGLFKQSREEYVVMRDKNFAGNKKQFAQEIVWYGRKGGKFLYNVKRT